MSESDEPLTYAGSGVSLEAGEAAVPAQHLAAVGRGDGGPDPLDDRV